MINIEDKKQCCGCSACVQRCPKQCIVMKEDEEGFLYPVADKDVCIDCNLCEQVCPVLRQREEREPLDVYAAFNKNEEVRMQSSSGGVFTALAESIIKEGGVVFGARFNEDWEVVHDYVETVEGLSAFRGSKYVQSRIGCTFSQAEQFLKQGRKVLFSGTPCQIAGLKLFLRKEYENLLSVDFICHGVPSPRVWNDYKAYVEQKYHGKIEKIDFRNKERFGWSDHWETVTINGKEHDSQVYMKMFYEHTFLREACYVCPYKNLQRISIADAWGVETANPEFDDNRGVSLVLINTQKGEKWFLDSLQGCDFKECALEKYMQEPLKGPFKKPDNTENVWKEYNEVSFGKFVKNHYKEPFLSVVKRSLKRKIKDMIPKEFWNRLRRWR